MSRKVLYFLATDAPTTDEAAAIQRLTDAGYNVGVRNGTVDTTYGVNLETADFVAGTIPTAYNAVTSLDHAAEDTFALTILPAAPSIAVSGSVGLQVLKAANDGTVSDVTALCTFVSATPAKATVASGGAGGGTVLGVAAGTSVITATYTYATGKTLAKSATVTVTA